MSELLSFTYFSDTTTFCLINVFCHKVGEVYKISRMIVNILVIIKIDNKDTYIGITTTNHNCDPLLLPVYIYGRLISKFLLDYKHDTYENARKSIYSDEFYKDTFDIIANMLSNGW